MTDEEKSKGWTEAGLDAMAKWLPALPRWIKTIFGSAMVYLVLCFVSQIPPLALPQAIGDAISDVALHNRAVSDQARAEEGKERADLVALLLEQNRELRKQAAADPQLAERVRVLEKKMDALLIGHPVDRARYEASR